MNKFVKVMIAIIFVLSALFFSLYTYIETTKQSITITSDVSSHYNSYVKTNKTSILYEYEDNEYKVIGMINEGVSLKLDEEENSYFKILNTNYYVYYTNVDKAEESSNNRYKKYVVFNENVITKETFKLYDETNTLVFEINEVNEFAIIVKNTDKYYVEYNDNLYYILKEDVESVKANINTSEKTRNNIRTLAYHFVYKLSETCSNNIICHPASQFDEHMAYLQENNYLTLTMKELEMFLDGNIRIPLKSVVITLDDGVFAKNAIEILEKYEVNATYFVITSTVDIDSLKSSYVELASHTDNMHNNYRCSGGNQGSQLLCEDEDLIKEDLNASIQKLNNTKYFAYPFYDFNARLIEILKDVGIKMAFVGAYNVNGIANSSTDRYKIPRYTIWSTTTMEDYIELLQ